MLMLVAASLDMPQDVRLQCTGHMMRGFNDVAVAAGTKVVGGQTVHNPWPIIGGVAQAIVSDSEFILPELGEAGDVRGAGGGLWPATCDHPFRFWC